MEFSYLTDITGNPVYKEKVDKVREVITRASRYKVREVITRTSRYVVREVISLATRSRIIGYRIVQQEGGSPRVKGTQD
jgi:hypothetical protein